MFDEASPAAAREIIADLGGPPKVAQMTKAPVTTVHSWFRVGLSKARLDHLRLAAERDGQALDFDAIIARHAGEIAA